jgi:hypothetical protein
LATHADCVRQKKFQACVQGLAQWNTRFRAPALAVQHISRFVPFCAPAILDQTMTQGGRDVDHALRLDVLAVCAVFAFVGAVLLGAF